MYYTLTLKGMLSLANAKFLKGCNGFSLDILARAPLWNVGMDYRCGTGHGIGYLLNVHESPNGFRWKHNPGTLSPSRNFISNSFSSCANNGFSNVFKKAPLHIFIYHMCKGAFNCLSNCLFNLTVYFCFFFLAS